MDLGAIDILPTTKAFSDETRFRNINPLLIHDLCVDAFASHLNMSKAAMFQYLQYWGSPLSAAQIRSRRATRMIRTLLVYLKKLCRVFFYIRRILAMFFRRYAAEIEI